MTADLRSPVAPANGMEPTHDLRAGLSDLLDVVLDKGVYLDLDLVITVADVPLIGVSLRAAVAGVETMLEHGLMQGWDEQIRRSGRSGADREVPLLDGEEIVLRLSGGHLQESPFRTWRPGIVYVTSGRLLVWRPDPRELLWQVALRDVTAVELRPEASVGGADRLRVCVVTPQGPALLTAAAPRRLYDTLRAGALAQPVDGVGAPGPNPRGDGDDAGG
ncbi:gas vesicle protein [Promicromonospora kroppenstedtii]|uniref:gas vesicle protein n=1 Tax=Promicromonospora kroppenstedtii TaxID=440482 RepID=UPI0004B8246E|nr:gas vesicle protein [Promicromonospora kroppenstedtii]